jgi:1-acyl-sn-glycerol-3-phosphate acyltransferase
VPIVPVAIEGCYEVWPRGKRLPQRFNPLRVSFGDPIYPPRAEAPTEADYAQLTTLLREHVVEMWQNLTVKPSANNYRTAAAD